MRKIIDFAVKRPASMIIIIAAIIVMGFFNLSKIPVDLLPQMDLPVAAVMTSYTGAGPEEVESQVSKPLEDALATLSNVDEIQSISNAGSSTLIITFDWGTNMDSAMMDIRDKMGLIEKYLPDGAEKPMLIKIDPNMMPVIQMTMGSDTLPLSELQSIAENVIEPRLSRISEVASVTITGGIEKEIKVEVNPVKLENYGLNLSQVTQFLRSENFNMSDGTISYGERDYFVRSLQEFESIEDIKDVALLTNSGNTVYLKDIADISYSHKDISQITRVNGENAVGIHCQKESDANTVEACSAVKNEIEKINKDLGADIDFQVVVDQSEYIEDSLSNTERMMFEGALLAVLIILLFLRNLRSTLIIFTAIPLSIIAAFILMYFSGNTINLITLGGIALGVGRMVDDSIVVFENIYRHRALGLPPLEAAVKGASEVGGAVTAATLTLVAVFFPMIFVEGIAGIMFKPLAITICVAIFASLFVALTVVPLMSSRMLTDQAMEKKNTANGIINRIANNFGERIDSLSEKYKIILQWALGNRRKVVLTVTGLMLLSLCAIPLVGAEFMPAADSGEISVNIETDKGTVLEDMNTITAQAEELLLEIPEIDVLFTSIGSSGNIMNNSQTNQAAVTVKLQPRNQRNKDANQVAEDIRQSLTDISGAKINVSVHDSSMGGGLSSSAAVNIKIQGDNLDVLREISDEISTVVRNVPGTREIETSLADGNPEVQVKINRKKAAVYGLTPAQISAEIKNAIDGTVAARYRVKDDEMDIRVSYNQQKEQDLDYLTSLTILTPRGTPVKLSGLASFELSRGPVEITRVDQVRQASITADILNRDLKSVMKDIQSAISKINLPAGYEVEYGGANQDMMESFASLAIALLLAIMLVYVVMVVQYESFFNPFVIMFSIPTAVIGIILSLLLTGRSLSVPAFIGIIMLVGIVVSNAIVLVDYLKQLRAAGMERNTAIIEAGRVRLRPILMTSLSTILAMLPMALGLGEGAETNAPLATVVIGGLLVSTFVTLVLVPVVYSILDDWGTKINKTQNHTTS